MAKDFKAATRPMLTYLLLQNCQGCQEGGADLFAVSHGRCQTLAFHLAQTLTQPDEDHSISIIQTTLWPSTLQNTDSALQRGTTSVA